MLKQEITIEEEYEDPKKISIQNNYWIHKVFTYNDFRNEEDKTQTIPITREGIPTLFTHLKEARNVSCVTFDERMDFDRVIDPIHDVLVNCNKQPITYKYDIVTDETKKKKLLDETMNTMIIQECKIYEGKQYTRFKNHLKQRKEFRYYEDHEFDETFELAVITLCALGLLEFRDGYLFGTDKIRVGQEIPPRIAEEQRVYLELYKQQPINYYKKV